MPIVPVLTSAAFLAGRGEFKYGPAPGAPDFAEIVTVEVDAEEASWAGSYWSYGYAGYLETGDTDRLDLYRSMVIGGYPVMTDPDMIDGFYYDHGHIDFQEYYQS